VAWYHTRVPCLHGTMVWYRGTKLSWHHGTMATWYHDTMASWYQGAISPWCHGTMVSWVHGTMVPWSPGTLVPCVRLVPEGYQGPQQHHGVKRRGVNRPRSSSTSGGGRVNPLRSSSNAPWVGRNEAAAAPRRQAEGG